MIKRSWTWLKQYMLFTCLEESEYADLTDRIEMTNRKNLCIFSAVSLVFLGIMIVVALFNVEAHTNLIAYVGVTGVMSIIGILSKIKKGTTLPLVYLFSAVLLGFGIIIGTVTDPNRAAGTFIALLLTIPLLFVDRPIRIMLLILCSDGIFILLVFLKKSRITWSNDLINGCVFGLISIIISSYMIRVKLESFRNEKIISQMAKMDIMTGLKNRNCFENDVEKYTEGKTDLFCIFIDVNGLHELNNREGHAAGDAMLVFIASELRTVFCGENVYRMGGDEFLVCGSNKKEPEIKEKLELFHAAVNKAGYYVAVGVYYQQMYTSSMEEMVRQAEKNMLMDKSEFYKNTKRDRRKR